MKFLLSPDDVSGGAPFTVVVSLENPNSMVAVTLEIGVNPTDTVLEGNTTVNAVGGIATFTNLVINPGGVGYTLVASAPEPLNPQQRLYQPGYYYNCPPCGTLYSHNTVVDGADHGNIPCTGDESIESDPFDVLV